MRGLPAPAVKIVGLKNFAGIWPVFEESYEDM